MTSSQLAELIAAAAEDKKAGDVTILDLRKLDTLTDFFVICTGDVDQHVRAIADHIEERVRDAGERVLHREGTATLNWVLLDFVNVVVHVFRPSFRAFYRLEDLWGDADVKPLPSARSAKPAVKPKAKTPKTRPAPQAAKVKRTTRKSNK